SSRFARVRVRIAHRDYNLTEARPEEWLLIEWPEGEDEPTKYWLSTLPKEVSFRRLVDTAKLRWRIGVSRQRARCHVGESPTEAKRLRLRSKGGAVARKQDGGALRQHARKECARSIRLQPTVNAYVASLHVLYPVAETVDNARRQQGSTKGVRSGGPHRRGISGDMMMRTT